MQTPNELLPDWLQMELLWENASPTSQFAPQTVSLDLSKYKNLLIEFKLYYTVKTYADYYLKNENKTYSSSVYTDSNRSRTFTINSNSINFEDAYINGKTINNNHMIPYQIYGVR